MPVFRDDFRKLSRLHLASARLLLKSRSDHYTAAYYLTGFAVECGLKACIAKATQRHEFPDKDRTKESYQHNLKNLVAAAGLQSSLDVESQNAQFEANWGTVAKWRNECRYEVIRRKEAVVIYSAATARKQGVMQWIRKYW